MVTGMKILAVSDSHGRVGELLDVVGREVPDVMFHLGDLAEDAEAVMAVYPDLPVYAVPGNCDGWNAGEAERVVTIGGVRCFLTHGHHFQVKLTLSGVLRAGEERGADAVLFGHTHRPLAERQADGMWLVNPGTVGGVYNRATYAVLEAENGGLSVELKEL